MKSEKITLYFKQGSSDKVYMASLEELDTNKFTVNFAYGRRGSTLTVGTKTKIPVNYEAAKKIYDKLVKSKTVKGYIPGEDESQYVHTDADSKDTGVQCQLLNFIEESNVADLIADDAWWAQEKHDGKRMLIRKTDKITAINRTGFSVGAPGSMLSSAAQPQQTYLIDGEAVGMLLFTFDILELDNKDIRSLPYSQRLAQLKTLNLGQAIIVVETAKTTAEKQALYNRLKTSNAEGIVFKKHTAAYTPGRPNSGGTQLKFKFYATASVIVTKINNKRSVAMAVMADDNQVDIGNVTIPPNKEIPAVGSIIEVRYLYAYKGGSLYQPTYLAVRDDIGVEECAISQLKYKQS